MDDLDIHIVQTEAWGTFKKRMGNTPVKVGGIQFTKHKIPGFPYYVGYAPRVNFFKQKFSWEELKRVAKNEHCSVIRFDVPNVLYQNTPKGNLERLLEILNKKCTKAPRDTFSKWNVLLDISPTEKELIANFDQKTRYNSRLAAKKGVVVKVENNEKGINIFNKLHQETATRQKFLSHKAIYYKRVFETLHSLNMINILVAYYQGNPLASWILLNHDKTLYYPYGGSSAEYKNLMSSNLLAWESIKLGKKLGCNIFDMWGATHDKHDPWWGFTKFKLGYGGDLIRYIDSYDLVINPVIYHLFNLAYSTFWKIKKSV